MRAVRNGQDGVVLQPLALGRGDKAFVFQQLDGRAHDVEGRAQDMAGEVADFPRQIAVAPRPGRQRAQRAKAHGFTRGQGVVGVHGIGAFMSCE